MQISNVTSLAILIFFATAIDSLQRNGDLYQFLSNFCGHFESFYGIAQSDCYFS